MALAQTLMRKYGILHTPTQAEMSRWLDETEKLLKLGADGEASGAEAAQNIFPDIDLNRIDPQAENITVVMEKEGRMPPR